MVFDNYRIFKNTLNDNGLKQIVNECIRAIRNLSTIIGYVITNNYKIKCTNSKDNKISDHEVINIDLERSIENILRTTKTIKIFKYDKNIINNVLAV